MRRHRTRPLIALPALLAGSLAAQPAPRQGGVMLPLGDDYAEVVLHERRLAVFLVDEWGAALGGPDLRGVARIQGRGVRKDVHLTAAPARGSTPGHLAAHLPLIEPPRAMLLALRGVPGHEGVVMLRHREVVDPEPTPAQIAAYPLTTCFMSGRPLGEWGAPVDILDQGRLLRFCCNDCLRTYRADPGRHLHSYHQAVAARGAGGAR